MIAILYRFTDEAWCTLLFLYNMLINLNGSSKVTNKKIQTSIEREREPGDGLGGSYATEAMEPVLLLLPCILDGGGQWSARWRVHRDGLGFVRAPEQL